MNTNVKLVSEAEPYEGRNLWELIFEFKVDDFSFEYRIEEPYLMRASEWINLARNELKGMTFYGGNGDGSISCEDGIWTFNSCLSGGGGDVDAHFKAKYESFGDILITKINEAIELGYEFKQERKRR